METLIEFSKVILINHHGEEKSDSHYAIIATNILKKILGKKAEGGSLEQLLIKELPVIATSTVKSPPFNLSLYLLCKKKGNPAKFFSEMVSKWLIPGKLLNSSLSLSVDFKFQQIPDMLYTLVEIQFLVERQWDCEMMLRNFDALIQEIRLGVSSTYHAHRVLEMRGLSGNEKIGLIQEGITHLIERFPERFDYDIFSMMQQCFVISREQFKVVRECHYLVRVISSLYLLRKNLLLKVEKFPQKRQIALLFKRGRLHFPLGTKSVLGVFVGLNFLRENEVFAKKHLVRAIQILIPHIKPVEESYLEIEEVDYSVHLLYLEIEKEDKEPFTIEEVQRLRNELADHLKGRIEYLLRPIFMPRNEEEVIRHIIVLSHQLKYVKDLPQVVISFEEQTDKQLNFTVILVRVLGESSEAVSILIKKIQPHYEVVIERERQVGMIRNKYSKEAFVMRIGLPSLPFLREDDSVDLYAARREVLSEIQKAFGEVRDFNGGMISKQAEAFLALKKMLGSLAFQHKLLLEHFFHSLYPIECRSTLNPRILKQLFLLLIEIHKEKRRRYALSFASEEEYQLVLIDFYEVGLKQKVLDGIHQLGILSRQLVHMHLQTVDGVYLGYIYLEEDEDKKVVFLNTLKAILDF
jgi:hypothetical protein